MENRIGFELNHKHKLILRKRKKKLYCQSRNGQLQKQ